MLYLECAWVHKWGKEFCIMKNKIHSFHLYILPIISGILVVVTG